MPVQTARRFRCALAAGACLIAGLLAIAGPAAAVSEFEEVRLRFQSLDLDGSGNVNADEIRRYSETKMAELDQDGDGLVSREDYRVYTQTSQRYDYTDLQLNYVSGRFMAAYDSNFDQQVSIDEYRDLIQKAVFRWDLDENRQVTFEEYLSQLGNIHAECRCGDY